MNGLLDYSQGVAKLRSLGEEHLFRFWNRLDGNQKKHLLEQIEALDISLLHQQQALVKVKEKTLEGSLEPFEDFALAGDFRDIEKGRKLIAQGKVGCLLAAGGQGTRLRFDGPKGMFAVSLAKHKSLFQLFCEKTLAAGRQVGISLKLAIMTSPQNHEETLKFFENHHFFGLRQEQIDFFVQSELPLLNEQGHLFLEDLDTIAKGPDGNGSTLKNFIEVGLFDKWRREGIEYLNFVLIDNPLADPFDANLIGHHVDQKNGVTVKCTVRKSLDEKVGLLVKKNGIPQVVEYSEMPLEEKNSPKYTCANISLFCFTLDSLKREDYEKMPWHLAHKAVKCVTEDGQIMRPTVPMAWKFEKFIFDILPLAEKMSALMYPRNVCFAPLKNHSGPDDLSSVQAALQERDRMIIAEITGQPPPEHPFELSQDFYYPTPELLEKWKGRTVPLKTYIEP